MTEIFVFGLSDYFRIITINDTHYYIQEWNDFKTKGPIIRDKEKKEINGTQITFTPLRSVFGNSKWDYDIIRTTLLFKKRLIKKVTIK